MGDDDLQPYTISTMAKCTPLDACDYSTLLILKAELYRQAERDKDRDTYRQTNIQRNTQRHRKDKTTESSITTYEILINN